MTEAQYQRKLIHRLKGMFPGCTIMKPDPRQVQGVPDVLVLYRDKWAMLELKVRADTQPNQEHYVSHFNEMSFASFISPDTEEEVLNELQQAFRPSRKARIPQPQ